MLVEVEWPPGLGWSKNSDVKLIAIQAAVPMVCATVEYRTTRHGDWRLSIGIWVRRFSSASSTSSPRTYLVVVNPAHLHSAGAGRGARCGRSEEAGLAAELHPPGPAEDPTARE